MGSKYSLEILGKLALLLQLVILGLVANLLSDLETVAAQSHDVDTIETSIFTDSNGVERAEFAFREPSRGLPNFVLDMYCSSVRVHLYWRVLREEIKSQHRKGFYLRRMSRLAKHLFKEVKDIDKPFNATMLSKVDLNFGVKFEEDEQEKGEEVSSGNGDLKVSSSNKGKGLMGFTKKIQEKLSLVKISKSAKHTNEILEEINSSDKVKELDKQGLHQTVEKIKELAAKWSWKKAGLIVYTRWTTMWWMMMSCLFTKYYLWDPALDDFLKLKRSLLMWPELQLVRMQDLDCKPIKFFRRILDVCKILNPLLRLDFGQFNLEKMTRFSQE